MESVVISAANDITEAAPRAELRIGRYIVAAIGLLSCWQVYYVFSGDFEIRINVFSILIYGSSVAGSLLALTLAWRRKAASGAFALAVFLALFANAVSHSGLYAWAKFHELPDRVADALDLFLPAAVVFMTASLLRFSALFPEPLTAERIPASARLRSLRLAMIRPGIAWGGAAAVMTVAAVATFANPAAIRFLRPTMITLVLGVFIASFVNLRLTYRAADRAGRRRMFWVFEGFLVVVAIFTVASFIKAVQMLHGVSGGTWYPLTVFAGFILLIVCLTIAMFFSGALDPSLAIKRTAIYGVLGILTVFIFAGVENAVNGYLTQWIHLSESASGMIIGGTVALTIEPIKHHLTKFSERILSRWGIAPEPARKH
jgi:hypothetical protein